jgi:hypothetical protein
MGNTEALGNCWQAAETCKCPKFLLIFNLLIVDALI